MEKVRKNQRLECGSGPKAANGQWRVNKHPGLDGCHTLSRVQANCGELCTARKWGESYSGESAIRCERGTAITSNGSVGEEESKEVLRMGWSISRGQPINIWR